MISDQYPQDDLLDGIAAMSVSIICAREALRSNLPTHRVCQADPVTAHSPARSAAQVQAQASAAKRGGDLDVWSSTAAPVRAWWPGANRWPGRSVTGLCRTRRTGVVRPDFGADAPASWLSVGLAPPHTAGTGRRMFTGDRSGLAIPSCTAAGLAHRPAWPRRPLRRFAGRWVVHPGTRVTAPVHCAPPDNKPTPAERDTACAPWLQRELESVWPGLDAVVTLELFGGTCCGGPHGHWAWPCVAASSRRVRTRRPGGARGAPGDRLLPRQSAEHLHRQADRTDAGRGVRRRGRTPPGGPVDGVQQYGTYEVRHRPSPVIDEYLAQKTSGEISLSKRITHIHNHDVKISLRCDVASDDQEKSPERLPSQPKMRLFCDFYNDNAFGKSLSK